MPGGLKSRSYGPSISLCLTHTSLLDRRSSFLSPSFSSMKPITKQLVGNDPLDEVLRPPPNETPQEKEIRLAREEDAKRVSEAIDETIKAERQVMKKRKIVRLLLLGQSESGKYIYYIAYANLVLYFV